MSMIFPAGKDALLENLRLVQERICDTASLEAESQRLMGEMQMLADMVQTAICENARIAQDQMNYQKRYDELVSRYDAAKAQYDEVAKTIKERRTTAEILDSFAKALKGQEVAVTEFDEGLWGTLVDFMTVYSRGNIGVTFKDGTEIHIR